MSGAIHRHDNKLHVRTTPKHTNKQTHKQTKNKNRQTDRRYLHPRMRRPPSCPQPPLSVPVSLSAVTDAQDDIHLRNKPVARAANYFAVVYIVDVVVVSVVVKKRG